MKQTRYLLAALSLFALSCQKEEVLQENAPYALQSAQMMQESATGAKLPFPQSADFGTYVILQSATDYAATNIKWSYNSQNSLWWPTDYPEGVGINGPARVYAYAPHRADAALVDNKMAVSLPADQATDPQAYSRADILWATGETSATSRNLDLLFTHTMSKIVINLYAGKGFDQLPEGDNTPAISSNNIYFNGLQLKGKMDITTGVISDGEPADAAPIYPLLIFDENNKQGTGRPGDPQIYECIVLPQSVSQGGATISLLIEGALYTNELSLVARDLLPGTIHYVDLTVHESGFDIGHEAIKPWVPKTPDFGNFYRYNYQTPEIDLDKVAQSGITSTQRAQYTISSPDILIIGDGVDVGSISHEYLFDSKAPDRKIVAEAIVAYPMTPDKTGVDIVDGIALKVLRTFSPAVDPADAASLAPSQGTVPTAAIHGGEIDNMVYKEGSLPPVTKIYFYHNTVLVSSSGLVSLFETIINPTPNLVSVPLAINK